MVKKLQELLENRRFADVHKMLESVNSADIPSIFDELEEEQIVVVYRLLSKDVAAEVFVELDSDMQEKLINAFTDKELKNVQRICASLINWFLTLSSALLLESVSRELNIFENMVEKPFCVESSLKKSSIWLW